MTDKPTGLESGPFLDSSPLDVRLSVAMRQRFDEAWLADWSAAWAGIGWLARTDHILRLMDGFVGRVVENFSALSRQVDNLAVDVRKLAKAKRP